MREDDRAGLVANAAGGGDDDQESRRRLSRLDPNQRLLANSESRRQRQDDGNEGAVVRLASVVSTDDDGDDLGLTGCAGSCCCHPNAFCHRMIALFLMCMFGFGSYFCYDNPGALQVNEEFEVICKH